jgi:two-component system NtrC family sensor kinase
MAVARRSNEEVAFLAWARGARAMTDLLGKTKLIVVLMLTAGLLVLGAFNLRDRLSAPAIADDGVEWVNTPEGVIAKAVDLDSPLAYKVRKGDYLRAFYYVRSQEETGSSTAPRVLDYEDVTRVETVARYLDGQGVGGRARYAIEHHDPVLKRIYGIKKPLYDVDFTVGIKNQHLERGLYLAFIGLVYLTIGLFVLFRQRKAALTYHFFAWCLLSFVGYFYSRTFEFSQLDRLVSFVDDASWAIVAPVFLHFCAKFARTDANRHTSRRSWMLLYVPAVVLVALRALWHYDEARLLSFGPRRWANNTLIGWGNLLDKVDIVHFAAFLIVGSLFLVAAFVRSDRPLLRQQLKWIIWGLGLSGLPFAALYLIPYISNITITPVMETISCVPLILIPLSFGYSIVRYRLMDVDVIMRRSIVHVFATIAVAAIYMVVLLGVGDLVKFIWATADLNSWKTKVVVVAGMVIVARLFSPIQNKLQEWTDRWFYGERYTLRTGLQDFGRTLASTTALPHLLDSLVRRLSEMLSVDRVAIFVEDYNSLSGFRLAHATGVDVDVALPADIERSIRFRSIGHGFVTADDLLDEGNARPEDSLRGATTEALDDTIGTGRVATGLHYYVPCIVRDRLVAIIAMGRTTSGALLTTEDTELMRTLSGYVAVAIDNSLLYRSEMKKADELARLKEFSENIIESVNVGIIAVDFEGKVTTWNSALEEIFGITRERAFGREIERVLDADLIETIHDATGHEGWAVGETRHIYKYSASAEDGRPLTLNISLAPFEAASGVVTGTLIVIENVTERAQLEQQLLQSEKLSSIGLLAAGVAHEVNTPLAGISSYAQMLLQQPEQDDSRRRLLEKIHQQTVRATGIVNNLLNFSRTGDTQFRELDLNKVLEDTLQLLEPQLRQGTLEVVRHFGKELLPAWGNPSKLQQVFMNLILNARDAMPVGGKLTINTRLVDTSLMVDFRDTGVGIAPENIARIYDPFFTTKDVGQGTGLGLALSYGIVQEHGGRIFVESRPGEGTHFTIKLPTAMSRQMQAASD